MGNKSSKQSGGTTAQPTRQPAQQRRGSHGPQQQPQPQPSRTRATTTVQRRPGTSGGPPPAMPSGGVRAVLRGGATGTGQPQQQQPAPAAAAATPPRATARPKPKPKPDPMTTLPPTHKPTLTTYPRSQVRWAIEALAVMVNERKIAAFAPGKPDEAPEAPEECTLCMLYYGTGLNNCSGCGQGMCSDCFACLVDPAPPASKCPFCDASPFQPRFTGPKSEEELARIREEDERMRRIERAQLDAAIKEEAERVARKARGESSQSTTPQQQPASPPRPASPPPAAPPAASPLSRAELAELPSEVRESILREELQQRLITFYRFRNPRRVPTVGGVLRRLAPSRAEDAMAALVERYGPMPPVVDLKADVQQRLAAYYQLRDVNMPNEHIAALVDRFGAEPWRAMAAVVLEQGPEFDPTFVPLPATHARDVSDDGRDDFADIATPQMRRAKSTAARAMSRSTDGSASPQSPIRAPAPDAGGAASPRSPLVTSPTSSGALATTRRELELETRRQRVVTLLRFRRPELLPQLHSILTAGTLDDELITEQHIAALSRRLGPEPEGDELREDVKRRVAHFYAERVGRARDDVDALVARFRGREHELLAALVLKYGNEPAGAPLPPSAQQQAEGGSVAAAAAEAAQAVDEAVEDPELALALRLSLQAAQEDEARRRGRRPS